MRIRLKNGTEKSCTNPVEQKVFRAGAAAGWLCSFGFKENITSTELDEILTDDNISELTFCNDASEELFTITGYTKVTSTVIRYSEAATEIEVQFSKGL